jgi:hypothetical protein
MVEYGKLNREKHEQLALDQTKEKHSVCTFTPKVNNSFTPKLKGDRGKHLYKMAMQGSKLIAKHRSDKDPLQLDVEKS